MTRRLMVCAAFALVALASPSSAEEKKTEAPPAIDLTPTGIPIVWHGRLINYVFVTLHMPLSPKVDAAKIRDKAPYFRDALVRASHRTPFVQPWDFTHVDRRALAGAMMQAAVRIAGPGAVLAVEITDETPQKRLGLPRRP